MHDINCMFYTLVEEFEACNIRPVFGHLPEPNRTWLLVVYFSGQASQLSVYQSRDYHVYIPNTYQTRPVSCSKQTYCLCWYVVVAQYVSTVRTIHKNRPGRFSDFMSHGPAESVLAPVLMNGDGMCHVFCRRW